MRKGMKGSLYEIIELVTNFERGVVSRGGAYVALRVVDVARQSLGNGSLERTQLLLRAFGNQLNSTIGQVLHVTFHVESGGY